MSEVAINVGHLRALVERIERVEADIKDLNADKSDIYKEARGYGYDVKAIRAVVAKRKLDSAERDERDAIFGLYWDALNGASRVHVHEADEFDLLTGEIHDTQDQPETATGSVSAAQVRSEGFRTFTSPAGTDAVPSTPAASVSDAIARKDHQSVSPSSPDGSASTESAAGKVSELAQPSPPKQAEPIKAGEGVPPLSPAILSDEEVVPAFMKDKPGCLKLRGGHCKIGFATEALCAECADKRARAMK